ncbi:MAG: Holliday junction branch migration protein RuvA [Deltaproteobacteria bacterium]
MITRLSGTIIEKEINALTVDVRGVGYGVVIPLSTFYVLPDLGAPVSLFIHTNVREDAIQLFGFLQEAEREAFRALITINGVGPKLAISILSGISVANLVSALATGKADVLEAVPGIGKKTAQRLILELKDKLKKIDISGVPGAVRVADAKVTVQDDALSALVNLGYKEVVTKKAIEMVIKDKGELLTIDILLREALKILAG